MSVYLFFDGACYKSLTCSERKKKAKRGWVQVVRDERGVGAGTCCSARISEWQLLCCDIEVVVTSHTQRNFASIECYYNCAASMSETGGGPSCLT